MTPPCTFQPATKPENPLRLHLAQGVCDAHAINSAPSAPGNSAAILVEETPDTLRILAVGELDAVLAHPRAPDAGAVEWPDAILMPATVNAHTHLDLTHIGPQPYNRDTGFLGWVDLIREARSFDPAMLRASVRDGIARLRNAGVALVADIAGARQTIPTQVLREESFPSVSCLEVFGTGDRQRDTMRFLDKTIAHEATQPQHPVRFGLSPHATYSCGHAVYLHAARCAAEHNIPITTHLAETPEEYQFIAHATGPLRTLLERLGVWDDAAASTIGHGLHPVEHLAPILERARFLVAHVNDAPDQAIETLARTNTVVAYCPRASAYFHHHEHFGPHRYRDMIQAGILVTLGTDSIVNLPPDESASRLSTLDEARFLHRRDRTDPALLLQLITTNGALALGVDPELFTLAPGPTAGIIAVNIDAPARRAPDARTRVLQSTAGIRWAECPHLPEQDRAKRD